MGKGKPEEAVVVIVQARMTSTRLPGKILKEVGGKSLLEIEIDRLRQIPSEPALWIATTTNATDEPTAALAKRLHVPCFRGSENDVLSRYALCAREAQADVVVRVTADCPLIDPDVIEEVIQAYESSAADYASNTLERTYPRGLDVEVFSLRALEEAAREAREPSEREHVTPFIRNHSERYRLKSVVSSQNFSQHRWTVDTPDDFALIEKILTRVIPLRSRFRLKDVLQVLAENPSWSAINSHVEQKKE